MSTSAYAPVPMPGLSLRILRRWHDLKQTEVARILNMSSAQISRVENGTQALRPHLWRKAAHTMALGSPDPSRDDPLFVCASWEEQRDRGILRLIQDGELVGLIEDNSVAFRAAALLDSLSSIPIVPLPVWPSFFAETDFSAPVSVIYVRVTGPGIESNGAVIRASDYIARLIGVVANAPPST